jgi:GNAT superfamily N-acetyltransferase
LKNVTIRPLQDADHEKVIDLQWALNLFEDQVSHDRVKTREEAAACHAANMANIAERGGSTIVAETNGRVVGYLSLVFNEGEAFVDPAKRSHGYVQDVVVAENVRGQGISQLLLAEAERLSRAANLSGLALGMLVGNDTAERAYRRFGMHPHSIEMIKRF